MNRGESEYKTSYNSLVWLKWMDNKAVYFCSAAGAATELGLVGRRKTSPQSSLFLLFFINKHLLTFYTRVTYFMEPHLTARQTGIARSSVAHLFYSAFRLLVTRSVLPISTDLLSKVAVASREEVTATFKRVSSYRGGSYLRVTVISKNLIAV